jgi:hypothetical protein
MKLYAPPGRSYFNTAVPFERTVLTNLVDTMLTKSTHKVSGFEHLCNLVSNIPRVSGDRVQLWTSVTPSVVLRTGRTWLLKRNTIDSHTPMFLGDTTVTIVPLSALFIAVCGVWNRARGFKDGSTLTHVVLPVT